MCTESVLRGNPSVDSGVGSGMPAASTSPRRRVASRRPSRPAISNVVGSLLVAAALLATVPTASGARTSVDQAAPWDANPVLGGTGRRIARNEWSRAENRRTCAALAFADTQLRGTPRRANFAGGWAVAYDLPKLRSAWGVAGAGVEGSLEDVQRWPNQSSRHGGAWGWGLEGNTGPGYLAYLVIDGQGCLYNVWSNVSEAHLLYLINQLRFTTEADRSRFRDDAS